MSVAAYRHFCEERVMQFEIKKMETESEVRGKAYVHWKSWHETYPGLVSEAYLAGLTLEKNEERAFRDIGSVLVAKCGERVIGFVGYGGAREAPNELGEVFALYVLREYCGQGVGTVLLDAALQELKRFPRVCLWVLKENRPAIRFYEKHGFRADGAEKYVEAIAAGGLRMVRERTPAER